MIKDNKIYKHKDGFNFIYVDEDIYEQYKNNKFVKSVAELNLKKNKEAYFKEDGKTKKMIYFLDNDGYEWYIVKEIGKAEDFDIECELYKKLFKPNHELDWQEGDINDFILS